MGTFNISTNNSNISGYVEYVESDVSISNNTSKVTMTAYLRRTNTYSGTPTNAGSVSARFTIDGSSSGWLSLGSVTVPNNKSYVKVGTWSKVVSHNSDGSKSVTLKYELTNTYGITGLQVSSSTPTITLTTIARASQPSCITWPDNTENVGDMGTTITIHMNKKGSFTHTVRYIWYNKKANIKTGVTDSCSWTIPLGFANDVPNSTSGWGTIYVDTYSGSTLIGTKSCKFVTTVPSNIVPAIGDISWTKTSGEPDSWPITQGVSKGTMSMVNVTGAYGSTIKTYSLTFAGLSSNSSSLTVNNIASSGILEATATVIDSRNRSATRKVSFSVSAYTKPTLTATVYRCDATGNEDDSGEYMYVNASVTITEVGDNAIQSIVLQYKKHSDSLYTSVALSNNTLVIIDASSDYTWDWIITASDKIYPVSDNNSIATGEVVLDILANGKGIAFGKVAEEEGVIDTPWNMKLLGQPVADFIVEQGTSGIWTYRKWNSGIAECWGTTSEITITGCETWGSIYIADGVITEQTYPFNFIEIPKCTITPKIVSYNFWIYPFSKGTVSATGKYSIARGSNASNFAIQADLYVIGKWK